MGKKDNCFPVLSLPPLRAGWDIKISTSFIIRSLSRFSTKKTRETFELSSRLFFSSCSRRNFDFSSKDVEPDEPWITEITLGSCHKPLTRGGWVDMVIKLPELTYCQSKRGTKADNSSRQQAIVFMNSRAVSTLMPFRPVPPSLDASNWY